jgi:hypothetical protein
LLTSEISKKKIGLLRHERSPQIRLLNAYDYE